MNQIGMYGFMRGVQRYRQGGGEIWTEHTRLQEWRKTGRASKATDYESESAAIQFAMTLKAEMAQFCTQHFVKVS